MHRRCSGRVLAALSNVRLAPASLLRLAYGLSSSQIPPADLVVSAGAETLAASVAIAQMTGAPNIYCGSLRGFRPEGFRLVLTSYPSHVHRPRHVLVLKPSPLSRGMHPVFLDRLTAGAVPRTMGLLLGGNSGECRFEAEDWGQLLEFVDRLHQSLGIRWMISNSRRTPENVSDLVAARVAERSEAIARYVDVRTTGPGTLGRVLENVEAVICTDDSSSMISECISAGRPVIGVQPRQARFTPDEQGYRKHLVENGWYRSLPIAALTTEILLDEIARIRPLAEDPLDRLAIILRERLPELFGGMEGTLIRASTAPEAARHQLPIALRPLGSNF